MRPSPFCPRDASSLPLATSAFMGGGKVAQTRGPRGATGMTTPFCLSMKVAQRATRGHGNGHAILFAS
eukprot:6908825-Prymnesium_polylepis.1